MKKNSKITILKTNFLGVELITDLIDYVPTIQTNQSVWDKS